VGTYTDTFRRGASYVDRTLQGQSQAICPPQNRTKLQLAIELQTAKTLGLALPVDPSSLPTRWTY
jgi:putative ABC transport system substrate-binding protein